MTNKKIKIFQVFNSRIVNGKVVYLARTENHVYKYFEVDKQIPWVDFVACIHADDTSDEVIFLDKIEDFNVVSESPSGLSMDDAETVKNSNCTIINCYRSGVSYQIKKIVLGEKFKNKIISEYKNRYGYVIDIKGNYLSETESKVIQYKEKEKIVRKNINPFGGSDFSNGMDIMRIENLVKIYNDIKDKVKALDIEAIIDSYHVKIESDYINKVGGDDTYYDYYVSECKYTDNYLSDYLPNLYQSVGGSFDAHYPSSSQEKNEWWEKCKEMEHSAKIKARKEYNREKHIYVLFAYEIRRLTYRSESKYHEFELLKQYVNLTWEQRNPYISIDNNMKTKLAEHNKGRNAVF